MLIHAGDLTNQGSLSELRKTIGWLEEAGFEVKIVVAGASSNFSIVERVLTGAAGNHDITLDTDFYAQHGLYFHNQELQDLEACQNLLKNSATITYLSHESRKIQLRKASGPHTSFTVFGSPFSPVMPSGKWAFQYEADRAARIWEAIPLDADIVVTHAPPRNHCDTSACGSAGCEALRRALWRVRPKLAICGHVHEGRGVERVRWKLDLPLCPYLEESTTLWQDPGAGNQKLSLVNLTSKGGNALDHHDINSPLIAVNRVSFSCAPRIDVARDPIAKSTVGCTQGGPFGCGSAAGSGSPDNAGHADEQLSRLHDRNVEALVGRMGRRETCVINAAIMATSYGSPKRFNKPIVVDVDLPVWRES